PGRRVRRAAVARPGGAGQRAPEARSGVEADPRAGHGRSGRGAPVHRQPAGGTTGAVRQPVLDAPPDGGPGRPAGGDGHQDPVGITRLSEAAARSWAAVFVSRPVVGELEGDAEVALFEGLDHRLELVLLLARDPELILLDLRLHLEPEVLDRLVAG